MLATSRRADGDVEDRSERSVSRSSRSARRATTGTAGVGRRRGACRRPDGARDGGSVSAVLERPLRGGAPTGHRIKRAAGEVVHRRLGDSPSSSVRSGPTPVAVGGSGVSGRDSVICFPPNTLFNEQYIHIGAGTLFGPQITLSAGMVPGQEMVTDPVIAVGDRCLIGKGSGIVGHLEIRIGDDVWTGHHVYITDQNHGYERPRSPDLDSR